MDRRIEKVIAVKRFFKIVCALPFFLFILSVLSLPSSAHPLNSGYSQVFVDNKTIRYELIISESNLLTYDIKKIKNVTIEEIQSQQTYLTDYLMSRKMSRIN